MIGMTIAKPIKERISSTTAAVMMPVAALEVCKPSDLRETIVRLTAVAIMVRPHIIATFQAYPKSMAV